MSIADSLSPLLGLLLMGDGLHNNDWGDQLNNNQTMIEQAIAGVGQITGPAGGWGGAVYALTAAQVLPGILVFSGALSANQVVTVPASAKKWLFDNQTTGAFTLTVQTPNGTGVALAQGSLTEAYCDGTNVKSLTIPGTPVGVVEEYYGVGVPDARYVWANGQAISRAEYALAFNVLTITATVSYGPGAEQISIAEDLTANAIIGAVVEGPGIASGTTVTSVTSNTMVLSEPTVSGTGAVTIRLFPYGNGDGASTFNVPDRRECVASGVSTMGGTASPGRLTSVSAPGLGFRYGQETHTLTAAEMPVHAHGVNDNGHTHGVTDPKHAHQYIEPNNQNLPVGGSGATANSGLNSNNPVTTTASATGLTVNTAATGISLANAGGGGAHNNLQPTIVCNYILRVA